MAESQVPYHYGPERLRAIRAAISEPRFAAYMKRSGNHEEYAFALYLYNSRLAKAFLFPLNIAEVTLRNAIDEMLMNRFGVDWHTNVQFRTLILTADSCSALDKAIHRAGPSASRDQIVATLTFDFWSNLFRTDYGDLWRTSINVVFPNLPRGESRRDVQKLVRSINTFRNRVAHHEPILDMNVTEIYSQIMRLTELRCSETASWLRHYSTINTVTRTRPRVGGAVGVTLASRADPDFITVRRATPLSYLFDCCEERHPVIVCQDDDGACLSAFTFFDLIRYVRVQARATDGLFSFTEHSVGDVLDVCDPQGRWVAMPAGTMFGSAVKELQKPRIQAVVAVDNDGKVCGTMLRAHRRY